MRNQFDYLGDADRIPCTMVRLKNTEVMWVSPTFNGDITECAYVIDDAHQPYPHDPNGFVPNMVQLGYADRYGSLTTVSIGSGRAVVVGEYQIKGSGLTPYSMSDLRNHYNSGMMSVAEARNELVYSKFFIALGIGTPIHGVLVHSTPTPWWNSDFWARRDIINFDPNGALVVRDFNLRPGHFMPSPCNNLEPFGTSEYLRLTELHAKFDEMVGMPMTEYLNRLPFTLAKQYARNICYRLSVGALTDTNISIDGLVVDYGSSNIWPSWDPNTFTTHTSGHSLWTERTTLGAMIHDWGTYANQMGFADVDVNELKRRFDAEYVNANNIAWANMVGSDDIEVGLIVERAIKSKPLSGHQELMDSINAIIGGDSAQTEFEYWLIGFSLHELSVIKVITTMNFLDMHILFHSWPNIGDEWWVRDDKWDILNALCTDVFSTKTMHVPFTIGYAQSTKVDMVALAIQLNSLNPIEYIDTIDRIKLIGH